MGRGVRLWGYRVKDENGQNIMARGRKKRKQMDRVGSGRRGCVLDSS